MIIVDIFPKFVIDATGEDAPGAGGVDAKLIVDLESVQIVFPIGWLLFLFIFSSTLILEFHRNFLSYFYQLSSNQK